MSVELFKFASDFVAGKLTADEFADTYQEKWKRERDLGFPPDETNLSLALSTTFLLADRYNPDLDRVAEELDEAQLREEVAKVLKTV